jgi:hypothetical protein
MLFSSGRNTQNSKGPTMGTLKTIIHTFACSYTKRIKWPKKKEKRELAVKVTAQISHLGAP